MSIAQRVFHGRFGRVALLNMDRSLVTHTHSECHVLVKVSGEDTYFNVNGRRVPLSDRTAVLVNAWEPHFYDPQPGAGATVILALYIEPAWLATAQQSLALSGRPDFFAQSCIELSSRNRTLADILVAEAHGCGIVPKERMEFMLFDFLIELIEDFSSWRHLSLLGHGRRCSASNIEPSTSIFQRLHQCRKGGGCLASVGVIQMVALKLGTPVGQDFFEAAVGQVRCDQLLRDVGQTNTIKGGIENMHDAVENKLPICLDRKRLAISFKLPGVNRP